MTEERKYFHYRVVWPETQAPEEPGERTTTEKLLRGATDEVDALKAFILQQQAGYQRQIDDLVADKKFWRDLHERRDQGVLQAVLILRDAASKLQADIDALEKSIRGWSTRT